jgi:hypothetical protein
MALDRYWNISGLMCTWTVPIIFGPTPYLPPITVAALSQACTVLALSHTGIVGSNEFLWIRINNLHLKESLRSALYHLATGPYTADSQLQLMGSLDITLHSRALTGCHSLSLALNCTDGNWPSCLAGSSVVESVGMRRWNWLTNKFLEETCCNEIQWIIYMGGGKCNEW